LVPEIIDCLKVQAYQNSCLTENTRRINCKICTVDGSSRKSLLFIPRPGWKLLHF